MWVGTSTITGAGTFTVGLPALNLGTVLTAVATSLEGGTSMFSQCRMVLPAGFAEWPVSQDGNGNIYEYVRQGGLSWAQANAEAQARTILGRTGRLVSISSASENAFVNALRDGGPMRAWIGLLDTDGAGDVPGPWSWTSGEGFTFSNWNQANPDALEPNNPGTEFWVEMFGDGTWNNNTRTGRDLPDARLHRRVSASAGDLRKACADRLAREPVGVSFQPAANQREAARLRASAISGSPSASFLISTYLR